MFHVCDLQGDPVERPREAQAAAETAWQELCASIAALHAFIECHSLCCTLDTGAILAVLGPHCSSGHDTCA